MPLGSYRSFHEKAGKLSTWIPRPVARFCSTVRPRSFGSVSINPSALCKLVFLDESMFVSAAEAFTFHKTRQLFVFDVLKGSFHVSRRSKMCEACLLPEIANVNGLRIWTMLLEEGFDRCSLGTARCVRWPADKANALKGWIELISPVGIGFVFTTSPFFVFFVFVQKPNQKPFTQLLAA